LNQVQTGATATRGYFLLGKIIEKVSGIPYEDYVQKTSLIRRESHYGYGLVINMPWSIYSWHVALFPDFYRQHFHLPDQQCTLLCLRQWQIDPMAIGMIIAQQAAGHPAIAENFKINPQLLNDYTGFINCMHSLLHCG